jgi:hypothetical protein
VSVRHIFFGIAAFCVAASASAACQFGRSAGGHEQSLQSVFDTMLGAGQLSAENDCIANDQSWSTPQQLSATIVVELSRIARKNEFGIYDASDPSNRIQLFAGRDGAAAKSVVEFTRDGDGFDVSADGQKIGEIGRNFGFYLAVSKHKAYFSDSQLNDGQEDHMVAYRGNGDAFVGGPLAGSSFAASMYLLGFENLSFRRGDRDYQDFVALVDTMAPVPIPSGIALLGSALIGSAVWRRRQLQVASA